MNDQTFVLNCWSSTAWSWFIPNCTSGGPPLPASLDSPSPSLTVCRRWISHPIPIPWSNNPNPTARFFLDRKKSNGQSNFRLFMNRNAIFLCESLCAEFPSKVCPASQSLFSLALPFLLEIFSSLLGRSVVVSDLLVISCSGAPASVRLVSWNLMNFCWRKLWFLKKCEILGEKEKWDFCFQGWRILGVCWVLGTRYLGLLVFIGFQGLKWFCWWRLQ